MDAARNGLALVAALDDYEAGNRGKRGMSYHDWMMAIWWPLGGIITAIVAIRLEIWWWDDRRDDDRTYVAAMTGLALLAWPLAVILAAVAAAFMVPFGLVMLGTGWRPDWWTEHKARRARHKLLREVGDIPDLRDLTERERGAA